MEILGKIRRMYLRDKLSLHEITKQTGLARNTIRTWLRKTEKAAPPKYRRSKKVGKLAAFHSALEQVLKVDAHRAKQSRRTAKDLFSQIKADGYVGGYSGVTDFIRKWRGRDSKVPRAFVPLKFELGEAFQFDWSEEGLVIGGIYRRMQVSHLKLCASRAFWVGLSQPRSRNAVRCPQARICRPWRHSSQKRTFHEDWALEYESAKYAS